MTALPAPLRLAYLTNIPSPYRAEMVRAWARLNPQLAISVFYTDADDQGRGWGADPIGEGVTEARLRIVAAMPRYGKLNRDLAHMVRSHDLVMIGGFEQASYLVAALAARIAGKPVILLFDGFSPARFGREPRPVLLLKRLTARLAHAFFANGTVGARYLSEQIGIATDRPVRNQFLSHRQEPLQEAYRRSGSLTKSALRRDLGIEDDGRPVLMTCGYLIRRKRIDLVIDAIARQPEHARPLLLVVGDGELRDELRAHAESLSVRAHFAGFRLGHELATYYLAADALVLASSDDPWGLVVNEAMAAGLPILASDACGATLDLVRNGTNGFAFRADDVKSLSDALAKLHVADLARMGEASRSMIAHWTANRSAENLGHIAADAMRVAGKS